MKRPILAVVTAASLGIGGCAKVVVVPVTPSKPPQLEGEGVFYALPRTVARVVVQADKLVTQSAPYARFAAIFAPGTEPPCASINACAKLAGMPGRSVKYSLQQGATFKTFGEPNPEQVFMVKFTGGGALDQGLSMAWTETGLLSTASASVTNRTTDIVVSGVKLATGLATKAAAGSPTALTISATGPCPKPAGPDGWVLPILELPGPDRKDILVANYCDLPPEDREKGKPEDSRDDFDEGRDKEALMDATRAYVLRVAPLVDQRTSVLTSTTVNALDPVKYLEKLDALIDEQLKALFVGAKSTKTWAIPFEVRALNPDKAVKILGINEGSGLCPTRELMAPDAAPPPDGVELVEKCDKDVWVSVAYHPDRGDQLFARIKSAVAEPGGDRSFRYVLPAQVKAVVSIGKNEYGAGVLSVAQLGHVVSLPAKRHSKTMSYELAMVEATGGLKTFKLGTTGGLDAATIDALAGAGGTVLDARNERRKEEEARRKAAETATDELSVLTRQQTILKLKDEICELQKKYRPGVYRVAMIPRRPREATRLESTYA